MRPKGRKTRIVTDKNKKVSVICDMCDGTYEVTESRYYEKMRKGWRYFYCSPKCAARARAEHHWEKQSPKNIPDELKRQYKDVPLLPEDMQGKCFYCHTRIKKSEIFCRKHATEENLGIFEATQELPFHPRGWWSYEIIKDWLRGENKILLKAPAGTGKSLLEDMIAYMNLTLNDGSFTLIGSISMPIAVQHIDRIREWVGASPFRSKIVYDSKEQIKLNTGSKVVAIAQNERTRGGYHPSLVLLDEIARIRPAAYYGLFYQMGKSKGACEIGVSTPYLGSGPFIHLWYSNTAHNYSVSLKDCWFISEKVIEDARKAMSPSYFDQVFKAEFVATSNRVFSDEQVINALIDTKSKRKDGALMGIDFGRKRDHTAVVILNNVGEIIYTEIFPLKISWREQYVMIRDRVDRFAPARIFGDATGLGDPILEELYDLNIEPVLMSNDKLKKRLVDNLLLCFSYNSIHIPRDEESLIDQLSSYVYLDDNLIKCGPEGGASDDLTDSLMFAALGLERGRDESEISSSWGAIGGQVEKSAGETSPWKIVW